MSKLVNESSLINWSIQSAPEDLKQSRNHPAQNPQTSCKVRNFIENSLKDNNDGWKRHLNHECMCSYCTCGKHMCKLHRLKPLGRHALSNYKMNYKKPERLETTPARFEQQYQPTKGVVKHSTYHTDYQLKDTPNKQKLKTLADNLKIGGPFFVGTTYKQEYYPKVSTNVGNIKMPSNNIFAMNIPLNVKSSYHDNYRKYNNIHTESFKPHPRAKKTLSLDYTQGSTYKEQFKLPTIDSYSKIYHNNMKKNEEELDHINKKSEYQCSFQPNALEVCPAVVRAREAVVVVGGK